MLRNGWMPRRGTVYRRRGRLGAWVEWEGNSSCGCLRLAVLERRRLSDRAGWLAAIAASRLPLGVVPALAVGMMTVDVLTAGFGQLRPLVCCHGRCNLEGSYQFQTQPSRHPRFQADSRWTAVRACVLQQAVKAVTGYVAAGMAVPAAVGVVCIGGKWRWTLGTREAVHGDSRPRVVVVGRHHVPARCRVP
jgi:hypothetical protein